MSCSPPWTYKPEAFVPGSQQCTAPLFYERRARSGVIIETDDPATIGLFFRSRDFGYETNDITIECSATTLIIRYQGAIVEQYSLLAYPTTAAIRNILDISNSIIELPPFRLDIADTEDERDAESGALFVFSPVKLTGGAGGPRDAGALSVIRTGPERSMCIITTTEDYSGAEVTPPPDRRVRQWNGFKWVSYTNTIPGTCPIDGV